MKLSVKHLSLQDVKKYLMILEIFGVYMYTIKGKDQTTGRFKTNHLFIFFLLSNKI